MYFRRLHWALAVVILAAFAVSGQVQKSAGDWAEWETISPEGEEFTVSMPKNPTTETTKFPYHKMELNARSYLATKAGGPVFAIVSLSGIKSTPGQYSDFARFNSYIDAFKDYFPPKVRTKDTALTKLVLVSSRPFHGHTGRQYKVSIGELSGVAHAFATRKRFYVVVSLNPKDEEMQEKFLTSFVLPERQVEQPKIAAAGEQPNAQQGQTGSPISVVGEKRANRAALTAAACRCCGPDTAFASITAPFSSIRIWTNTTPVASADATSGCGR